MNWTDLIIIYLAAGAPFAVHDYLSRTPGLRSAFRSAGKGLIWILQVPSVLHSIVTSRLRNGIYGDPSQREQIRDIESRLTAGFESHEVFRTRELLGRYAGLSEALNEKGDEAPDAQLFEISDHPDPELAGRILARRVRKELEERREAAANELVGLFAASGTVPHDGNAAADALSELFHRFVDLKAIARLGDVIGESAETVEMAQQQGGTLWNGSFAKQSIIRSNGIGLPDLTPTHTRPAGDWKD